MAPNGSSQVQAFAALADELTVRLRVLEESGANQRLTVGVRPSTGADIPSVVFEVMMEASNSASEDLQAIMNEVQAINAASGPTGSPPAGAKTVLPQGRTDLDAAFEILLSAYGTVIEQDGRQLLNDLGSSSELGATESLRLQMAMDRLSRLMTTLSNLLKKVADSNKQIVANLK